MFLLQQELLFSVALDAVVSKGLSQQGTLVRALALRRRCRVAAQCRQQHCGVLLILDTAGAAGDHLYTYEETLCKSEVLHWRPHHVLYGCWTKSPEGSSAAAVL